MNSEARNSVLPVGYLMMMNRSLNLFRCQFHLPWNEDNNNNFIFICFDMCREKVMRNSKCCNSSYFVSSIWGKREKPAACSVLIQGVFCASYITYLKPGAYLVLITFVRDYLGCLSNTTLLKLLTLLGNSAHFMRTRNTKSIWPGKIWELREETKL